MLGGAKLVKIYV